MLKNVTLSLTDLLGEEYINAVCASRAWLTGEDENELKRIADEKVSFFPEAFAKRQNELMDHVGEKVVPAFENQEQGAPTAAYRAAQHSALAPVNGLGAFRVGEDGRLFFTGKSEHYQISLGHSFPGYRLIRNAERIGIPNATHNNTRGYVTRKTERHLIALANGLSPEDPRMEQILSSRESGVINTVINLETGSLAVEAALKMMLTRFYGLEKKEAPNEGKIPVFLVMADNAGGITGNYHGTTVFAQTLRGLWPAFRDKAEECGLYKVVPVPINDAEAFGKIMETYNRDPYRTAGFCHEIIMMNYGGIRLKEAFLQECYRLCRQYDTPVLCDEIQSCAWYDGMFLFRQYHLTPDFVSIGKGFPGGVYPASKMLSSARFDTMSQFGALVTNGQEELASLAYLITLTFVCLNGQEITENGREYHRQLEALAERYPGMLTGADGDGFMSALCFREVETASAFCRYLNGKMCVDASAQTYKPNCPPVVLTKLPLITGKEMIGKLIGLFEKALNAVSEGKNE